MQTFKVAHIREQNVNLVIVFVSDAAGRLPDSEKSRLLAALQGCAISAGLAGTVVLVWSGGFYCDTRLHAFFRSVPYTDLLASINRQLTCPNL
jgi:hypothetical protein